MLNKRVIKQLSGAALALLISAGAYGAPAATALLAFPTITLTDSGGAPLDQAILTTGQQSYDVMVNGLGVGGAKGLKVTVTGEVYGLANLTDLEGPFVTELADAPPTVVSSDDLWLYSERGVSILLHSGNPGVKLAAGSDTVMVQFGSAQ
ncbi:hypothetical protein [uncultured Thiodictyon sp.]|uniref:hypothetical protein n=1 Tax=uncultured Thiodictyon sp. TaxID=1846217 RepID=UPI0025F97803|nr:hypothetical protein [uncultured Thiodictyon sp.]